MVLNYHYPYTDPQDAYDVICEFVAEVEHLAGTNLLKTGQLDGSFYAAMKQVQEEWRVAVHGLN